jgi:hypothetical protein
MFVAIWDERVVDFDEDKIKLARRVYEEIGYLPIYIQKVQKEIQTIQIPFHLTSAAKSTLGT